jgi:predicted metal-dependent enzyme (double-stranded beta helix superfamily)
MRLSAEPAALSRAQLRVLAAEVASDEGLWRHLVRHEPDRRTYEELLIDEPLLAGRVGLWLICWMEDHDTGFHDHDTSSGAVAVAAGRLREERLAIGADPRARIYGPGDSFDFGPSDIHRMAHAGGGPAVSIHAYSPPLQGMGAYVIEPDGVLQRTPIPYTQELRAPAHAAA